MRGLTAEADAVMMVGAVAVAVAVEEEEGVDRRDVDWLRCMAEGSPGQSLAVVSAR